MAETVKLTIADRLSKSIEEPQQIGKAIDCKHFVHWFLSVINSALLDDLAPHGELVLLLACLHQLCSNFAALLVTKLSRVSLAVSCYVNISRQVVVFRQQPRGDLAKL